jgi:hypothetical protein
MSENLETMRDLLAKKGFKVIESSINADIFLAIDHRKSELGLLSERASKNRFNILFRSEPECIIPSGYKEESLAVYDKTLTFGKPRTSPKFEFWPQFWDKSLHFKANRKEKIALINANKLNFHKTEMYSLRRKAAKTLDDVDLFGMDWNISFVLKMKIFVIELRKEPLKSLFTFPFHIDKWFHKWPEIDAPQDKIKLLKEYKYALVIENSRSYMSEKLFDALQSGCIPIYVGPRVEDFGIPPELVIQSPASLSGIKVAFKKAKSLDYLKHQKNIREWLEDPETIAKHSGEQVLNRAIEDMKIGFQEFNL